MKIAVVGAGLSGLAFSWHYKKKNPSYSVTLFDQKEAGDRTSSLANTLYPFVGMRSKLNWRGFEAFAESEKLIEEISHFSSKPIYRKTLLLKIANNTKEREAFELASQKYPTLTFKKQTVFNKPGLWINPIIQVEGALYLEALLKACLSIHIEYINETFTLEREKEFDLIIIATGYHAHSYFLKKITYLKGQALILTWPIDNFDLKHCLIYDGLHLIPSIDRKTLYVGNTFEREYKDTHPCQTTALKLLWPKLIALYPFMKESQILKVKAGIRLTTPSRLPKIGKLSEKKWIFSALGSKGLLYHSYLAKMLSNAIDENANSSIAPNVLFS